MPMTLELLQVCFFPPANTEFVYAINTEMQKLTFISMIFWIPYKEKAICQMFISNINAINVLIRKHIFDYDYCILLVDL